ncbi:MAG: outer membrane beta-barrel protein [Phaeodactylibacter xiamenensis]|uniref:Outer membrane protein beta-barrel domain-containing protein n=1 Tax=Phaeodactylibacter xiamenensis TaxID=1524460 RepID=A0A098SB21_9BACT|nr:outer membrane beta-barrel protein [Phaeodactylibacter xiamenensis]KGE89764.1 hypothetical protein IX84_00085 [Phaeodactylibacter xiamenensis]MCR9054036.1 outer membrane beta-barrel protein [bacterium]
MKNLSFPLFGIITLLFLSSASDLCAQYGRSGWRQQDAFDVVVGGDFGFHLISGNTADEAAAPMISNRQGYENNKLNYRLGFNYYLGLSPSLAIKAGARYANPGFTTSPVESFDPAQDINTVGKEFEPFGSEYRYEYQMFEFPVGVKYTLINSICEPYFEVGISPAIYWRTLVQQRSYEGGTSVTEVRESMNRLNFIGFLSVGGNLNLTQSLSGFTQLIGRYQLNNLRKGPVQERLLGLGLEMGLRYYL